MNINDVDINGIPKEGDMLVNIYKRQKELMDKYREIEGRPNDEEINLHTKEGQRWLKDMAWRIVEELGEAMNCLKNKPWKQTEIRTDENHYLEELADAFHFFIELCILSGLTNPEELYILYFKKSEVNKFRQRSKY